MTKALMLAAALGLGFIALGIVVGLSACASVQGLSTCLDSFARTLSAIF